jgi:hypothetical protein
MKLPRRRFLHLAAGAAALPAVSRIARAQAYPSRPVRLIVPLAPAGASDITARLIGQWLITAVIKLPPRKATTNCAQPGSIRYLVAPPRITRHMARSREQPVARGTFREPQPRGDGASPFTGECS